MLAVRAVFFPVLLIIPSPSSQRSLHRTRLTLSRPPRHGPAIGCFGGCALNLALDRNSSLKEVSNNDVNEVKTRKTDSWAYDNKGDPEAGERC